MCGCKNKWRGPTWGPRGRGRALHPRGHTVGPPGVFSVPIILKYSGKNHISFSGHLENFYFGYFYIARINQKTHRKILFLLYFN